MSRPAGWRRLPRPLSRRLLPPPPGRQSVPPRPPRGAAVPYGAGSRQDDGPRLRHGRPRGGPDDHGPDAHGDDAPWPRRASRRSQDDGACGARCPPSRWLPRPWLSPWTSPCRHRDDGGGGGLAGMAPPQSPRRGERAAPAASRRASRWRVRAAVRPGAALGKGREGKGTSWMHPCQGPRRTARGFAAVAAAENSVLCHRLITCRPRAASRKAGTPATITFGSRASSARPVRRRPDSHAISVPSKARTASRNISNPATPLA